MIHWNRMQRNVIMETNDTMELTLLRTWNIFLAFFRFKANPSHATLSVYNFQSRRLSKLLRISRRQYESKLADEVKFNPRRLFEHVRRNRRLKQRIMALRADGAVLTDSPNMARILANYYAPVFNTAGAVNDYECPTLHISSSTQGALHISHCQRLWP